MLSGSTVTGLACMVCFFFKLYAGCVSILELSTTESTVDGLVCTIFYDFNTDILLSLSTSSIALGLEPRPTTTSLSSGTLVTLIYAYEEMLLSFFSMF